MVGVLVGLTGMGGGSLMAPLLILVFKVQPVVAVGTDLVYMSFTKLFGAWQHHRQANVDYRLVVLLAVGSIPGALMGVGMLSLLTEQFGFSGDGLITYLLAGVLVIVGASLIFSRRLRPSSLESDRRLEYSYLIPILGAVIGFLVALTSVGSGSLFLILMVTLYALPIRKIIGTDVLHGFVLVSVAALAHTVVWLMGFASVWAVDFSIVSGLLIGSIPGVIIGSKLTMFLSERKLATGTGVVLVTLGARLLF